MTDLLVLFMILVFFGIIYLIDYFSVRDKISEAILDYPTFLFNKHEYYHSPEWERKRRAALEAAHYTCEMCHTPYNLHVHHISYVHIFQERLGDLVCVCHTCHEQIHLVHGKPSSLLDYTTQRYPLLPTHY